MWGTEDAQSLPERVQESESLRQEPRGTESTQGRSGELETGVPESSVKRWRREGRNWETMVGRSSTQMYENTPKYPTPISPPIQMLPISILNLQTLKMKMPNEYLGI